MRLMFKYMTLIAVFSLLVPTTLAAQTQDFAVNVRGGISVPTFDITAAAKIRF